MKSKHITRTNDKKRKKIKKNSQPLEEFISMRETSCRVIQVSTRGVGLIVTYTSIIAQQLNHLSWNFPLFPMYRVMLAFIEEKLALILNAKLTQMPFSSTHSVLKSDPDRVAVLSMVTDFPKFATTYIKGLGTFTHNEIDFVPILPKNSRFGQTAQLYPDPGNIILSNLREVVMAMKTSKTPLPCRKEFVLKNPFPNAIYNEKKLLQNENDIMPADYDHNQLRCDVEECNKFFGYLRDTRSGKRWIGDCTPLESHEGKPRVAVIQPRIMQIPHYRNGVKLRLKQFKSKGVEMYSPIPLQTIEWLHGAACLYREPPDSNFPYYSDWNGCNDGSNPYGAYATPFQALQRMFDDEELTI